MATFTDWEASVLRAISAPVTKANVAWLDAWQTSEGGSAAFNPLNTSEAAPGASDYNTTGVKNYTSASQGAHATATTLLNGNYRSIVAALRSGNPSRYVASSAGAPVVTELDTWGSHDFAQQVGAGHVGNPDPSPPPPSSGGGFTGWLTGIGGKVLAYLLLAGLAAGLLFNGARNISARRLAVTA